MPGATSGLLIVLALASASMPPAAAAPARAPGGSAPSATRAAADSNAVARHREDGDAEKAERMYADYMRALLADMRASMDPERRAVAAIGADLEAEMIGSEDASKPDATSADSLRTLAAAYPANLTLQWMTALSGKVPEQTRIDAIARLQEGESDNAAVWALSLSSGGMPAAIADSVLRHMASSTRFDTHYADIAAIMRDAVRRFPPPYDLIQRVGEKSGAAEPAAAFGNGVAFSFAVMTMPDFAGLVKPCTVSATSPLSPARRDACVATGQLMVDRSTTIIGMRIGDAILHKLDAEDDARADRVRHASWWWTTANESVARGGPLDYLDDLIAGGNEIDALQRYAERLGKAEPPAGWTPHDARHAL